MSSSEQSNKPTSASPEHTYPPVVAFAPQPFNGAAYPTPPPPGAYPPPFFAYPPPPDTNHAEGGPNGVPPPAPPYMMAFPPPPGMVYAFPPPPGQGNARILVYYACSHLCYSSARGIPYPTGSFPAETQTGEDGMHKLRCSV